MNISVVIPLLDEAESLPELIEWLHRVMAENAYSYEILLIDDGSRDNSWEIIRESHTADPRVRGIRFQRNYGKSAALQVGFQAARGDVIITMDADLQDSPDEIPELYRLIAEEGFDLISGWKKKRYDNRVTKNLPSKLFNWAQRRVSGVQLHDFNCGLKAYRSNVAKSVEVYGEMHRFIPFLAKAAGFNRIDEKVVQHQARKYGRSKFGVNRFVNGFLDLLTLSFILKYGRKPMHFFGPWGVFMFLLGGSIALWLVAEKLFHIYVWETPFHQIRGVTEQPLFFFALTTLILGTQLFLAGFLGELTNRKAPDRNRYAIREEL